MDTRGIFREQSDTVLQALVNVGLDESVLGKIREKIPGPPPVEKKKERHLADFRDKRDKAQRGGC